MQQASRMLMASLVVQVWFEGGYSEYEADLKRRTGNADPTRVKYRRMAMLA